MDWHEWKKSVTDFAGFIYCIFFFFFGTDKFITSLQVCCYDCHSEEEQTEYKNTSLYQVSSFVKVLRQLLDTVVSPCVCMCFQNYQYLINLTIVLEIDSPSWSLSAEKVKEENREGTNIGETNWTKYFE